MIWQKFKLYLRLGRIHSSILSALAPIVAAIATGISSTYYHYLELFIIGILFHLFLFIYNEICDVKIDKTSEKLKGKPLVDGSISLKSAKSIVIFSLILILLLNIVFFKEKSLILIPIILLALLFAGLYDFLGKRFSHSDYFLATSYFILTIYGGFSVSYNPNILVFIIGAIAFMQMLFQNIVAGLKDIDHDYITGGMSTALRLGVKVDKDKLIITKKFILYILIIKTLYLIILLSPFIFNMIQYEYWQVMISIFLIVLTIIFIKRFLTLKLFKREKIMRAIGFHEMFTFMVVPFILLSNIGFLGLSIFIFLPVIWLGIFLIFLYGRLMPLI